MAIYYAQLSFTFAPSMLVMSLVQKLKLKPEYSIWLLQCPQNLLPLFDEMDKKEKIGSSHKVGQLVFFALNKKELDKVFPKIMQVLTDAATWIAYPKKSSGIVSDLIRDEGWKLLPAAVTSSSPPYLLTTIGRA